MLKQFSDEQVVRGLMRNFPNVDLNRARGLRGLDVGTGAGRHAKLLYEFGFNTTAIDLDKQNIQDAKGLFEKYGMGGV